MYERMQILTEADQSKIHLATMDILRDIGINFYEPEAVEIFKRHGFKVDGNTVHIDETQIRNAMASVKAALT